eukprot:GFKZ01003231.1.p1 GENE.GFKZ01003231.1~~GFKZ01003231.1.p1  ORF type:complete len:481 (+),score=51.20 GFKZ01003231.1:266-1708(+)
MVSVGVLAALLNVLVLITVAIADRALEFIIRNFAISRLQKTNRAPVVHDSDTWLLNLPRSVLKYRRHPAILLTVMCAIFLIVSEVITELGVEQSSTCKPVERNGLVITPGDSKGKYTTGELLGIAFHLRATSFVEGPLTSVPAGMPKNISGKECLSCLKEKNHPDVVRACTVTKKGTYEPGQLEVAVRTTTDAFGTICDGFRETGGDQHLFQGVGDLTGNGRHRAMFLCTHNPGRDDGDLVYFEYSDQSHIGDLLAKGQAAEGQPVWDATKSRVNTYTIRCEVNELSPANFRLALMVYRTMILENPVALAAFNETEQMFEPISRSDVYRSVLSMKVMEDSKDTGTSFEYTECGRYNLRFLAPILTVLFLILFLGLLSIVLAAGKNRISVPHNSRTWFQQATDCKKNPGHGKEAPRSGYFNTMNEEMVLVQGSDGPRSQQVVFHFRSPVDRHDSEVDRQGFAPDRNKFGKDELVDLEEHNV